MALVWQRNTGARLRGTMSGFFLIGSLMSLIALATTNAVDRHTFATFAVLGHRYGGGPGPKELFELPLIAVNTAMLLFSSLTYGFAMLAMHKGDQPGVMKWLAATAGFGLCFLAIELYEFNHLIHIGAGPGRSAFLSAFFTLVGTHGLHVTFGLIWMATLVVQVRKYGLTSANRRRLECLSMFWHFLDVIWIGVFTFVYLMGMI